MHDAEHIGGILAGCGFVIIVGSVWRALLMLARHSRTFTGTVIEPDPGETGVRVAPDAPETGGPKQWTVVPESSPVAFNAGDRLRVAADRDNPGHARLYRPDQIPHAMLSAFGGVLCVLAGWAILRTGWTPYTVDDEDVVKLPLLAVLLVWCGMVGLAVTISVLRDLPGSRKVTGTVESALQVSGRKTTHVPLIRYRGDNGERTVWGVARWSEPKRGTEASVRVGGRPPHEAVRTSPLAGAGMVLLYVLGATGIATLYYLAGPAMGWSSL